MFGLFLGGGFFFGAFLVDEFFVFESFAAEGLFVLVEGEALPDGFVGIGFEPLVELVAFLGCEVGE